MFLHTRKFVYRCTGAREYICIYIYYNANTFIVVQVLEKLIDEQPDGGSGPDSEALLVLFSRATDKALCGQVPPCRYIYRERDR
jgi:hypothetical protein